LETSPRVSPPPTGNRSSVFTLIAAYLGLFVGLIDSNAVNLALPAIRADLGGGVFRCAVDPQTPTTSRSPPCC